MQNEKDMELEVYEVDDSTVLEFMGASIGLKGCCSITIPINGAED